MRDLLDRPELALAAALVVALMWVVLAFAARVTRVGDDDAVSARLDALRPDYEMMDLTPDGRWSTRTEVPHRDYSGDRGVTPEPRRRYESIYDELCDRLGVRPCKPW